MTAEYNHSLEAVGYVAVPDENSISVISLSRYTDGRRELW
jgi:hypothetical protein